MAMKQVFLILIGLLSCPIFASVPPPSEPIDQLKSLTEVESSSQRLAQNYYFALEASKGEKSKSCELLKQLGKNSKFPLNQLASIKSFEICDQLALDSLQEWKELETDLRPYLKENFYKVVLSKSLDKKLWEKAVEYTIALTNELSIKGEKEKVTLNTLNILKKEKKQKAYEELYAHYLKIAPRFIKKPSKDQYYEVAQDFYSEREFNKARKYFRLIYKDESLSPQDRIKAFYKFAFSYKLERSKVAFSDKLEELISWFEKNKWLSQTSSNQALIAKYLDLRIELARAQWTINRRTRAEQNLENLIKTPLAHSKAKAFAYLLLGQIEIEKKNLKNSDEFFKQGLNQSEIEEEILQKLSWSLGWSEYLKSNFQEASGIFEQASKKLEDPDFRRKLTFWRAKCLEKMGKESEAKEVLKSIIKEDDKDYYAVVAAMELNTSLPKFSNYEKNNIKGEFIELDWLNYFNEEDLSRKFLKNAELELSGDNINKLLSLYPYAGWYDGGIIKYYRLSEEQKEQLSLDGFSAIFPTPYYDSIKTASQKAQVPESFLYAIARQESAFNKEARSWADAFGLLQLTPEKAKQLSKENGIPFKDYLDLYDVEKNMLLGSLLFKQIASSGKGEFISVVATYNAGATPVKRWYQERFRKDPLEFIEMIPYRETQKYVKLVLRNFSNYERLLGRDWNQSTNFFEKKFF